MNVYIGKPVVISDMQGPSPDGFHIPLTTEWQTIYDTYTGLGLSGGVNFATYLKLPMAGYRYYSNAILSDRDSVGIYWSSTVTNTNSVYSLSFSVSGVYPQRSDMRSSGIPVRCLKNSPVVPTSSWAVIYQGSGNSGIFHNATDGLISISSDGTTWYTIMDKNLGATTVYNYGDTLTEANCGKVYQRGNNYAFSGDANYDTSQISKSSTQVNVTGYGPGNYYESSTWITKNPRQSSANNGNNLRGGVSQGSTTKSVELKNAYIGEVYEYSYDFRNKTTTQLSNDGFSVYEGTWKVNASGLSSNSSSASVIVNKSIQSLLNATKLTITQNCILSNGSLGIRLNGTGRTYATGMYMGTTENYQTLAIAGTANNYSGMSAGTYTQTAVFDFVNKTATLSCTGKSDHTETMTDAQIANIKNNINNIEFYIDRNSSYIQTVNIVVCY